MTVEEGHVLNIDGGPPAAAAGSKYKEGGDRAVSAISRGSAFQTVNSDVEDGGGHDRVSVLSGGSGKSKTTSLLADGVKLPWYKGVTCKDIRDIMPTVLILLIGLLIMIFVIPYAFSSVIKQLENETLIEQAIAAQKEAERKAIEHAKALAEAELAAAEGDTLSSSSTDSTTIT